MINKITGQWDKILSYVKESFELTDVSYKTWVAPLEPVRAYTDKEGYTCVDILIPDADKTFKDYVTRKYTSQMMLAIEEVAHIDCKVVFLTNDDLNSSKKKENVLINNGDSFVNNDIISQSNLNPKYTFDAFVVGKNNNLAHAASLAVAESPGEVYNPLFIYGGSGLGKTHLMQSIAHFILKKDPNKKVLYVPSEPFTNEVIDSIRKGSTDELRNKYRNNDIFLLDDIQFIIGKESTQLEFFNTFNSMVDANRQVIISSDRPPKDFTDLDERLISRLGMGLIVDIQSPDYETRMAILRKMEESKGYNIDNEVIKYIAENIKSNIRNLEGALIRVMAMSKLDHNNEITVDFAKEVLKDIISPEEAKIISPNLIIDVICDHFSIKKDELLSQKRTKEIVYPRQIAMYLIRQLTSCSQDTIGSFLGGRDHTTVLHSINKIEKDLENDQDLIKTVNILKKKLSTY